MIQAGSDRSSQPAFPCSAAGLTHRSLLHKGVWACLRGSVAGAREDSVVGFNFIAGDRDQVFLLPPDMRDWLPAGHLAWFVIDVVDQVDLSRFHAAYRADGHGRAAYDPAVLVAILLYAYCCGIRSSRVIERRCREDVAFRVLAGGLMPDHVTLARFRSRHADALAAVFVDSLRLCAEAGLVRLGAVALDGTKIGPRRESTPRWAQPHAGSAAGAGATCVWSVPGVYV